MAMANDEEPSMTNRQFALGCAVLHYGLANLITNAVPAKPSTIARMADKFEGYLNGGEVLDDPPRTQRPTQMGPNGKPVETK